MKKVLNKQTKNFQGQTKLSSSQRSQSRRLSVCFFFHVTFYAGKMISNRCFLLTFWGIFASLIFLFFSFKMIRWKGDRDAMPQVKNISITIHWILSDFFGFTFQAGCITLCDQPEKDFKTRNYSTDAIWSLLTLFFSNTSKIGHSGKEFNPA